MRSSNPVFSRRGFTRGTSQAGAPPTPYGTPQTLTTEQMEQMYAGPSAGPAETGRMTMDDVVVRTAVTLGTVVLGVVLGWFVLPMSLGMAFGAALIAFVLAIVQGFKRTPVPALILGYAVFEGVFLGVLSRVYNEAWQGAPVQAVLGTMAVFGGTLLAYRARIIRVTARYQRIGLAVSFAFVVAIVVNLLFAAFGSGDGLGLRTGGLGIVFCLIGIGLGAFFLSLDFKQIEDGIRYGAPRRESWLAAFGLTLTLVWIYLELLRLISILRD